MLGDNFLKEIFSAFESIKLQAQRNPEAVPLYIQEFFNVKKFENTRASGTKSATGRMINSLIDAVNTEKILPKYLLIIPDKDITNDFSDVFLDGMGPALQDLVSWFVCQIDMIIRRRRATLLEKKPRVLYGYATKIIYVRMLRRYGSFHANSKINGICDLRVKFNDALNNAVAKTEQYILTVNSCNSFDHFDRHGMLSTKGKSSFWYEVDDLIKRFGINKVKLLPNPKNHSFSHHRSNTQQGRRKLPTPPEMPSSGNTYHKSHFH